MADSQRVNEVERWPYCSLCQLEILRGGQKWWGTGWLAGQRTVVTAAHNLATPQDGVARQVVVRIARDGVFTPPGVLTVLADAFRIPDAWLRANERSWDMAAIQFPATSKPGERFGQLGFRALSPSQLTALPHELVGYPRDKGGAQWSRSVRPHVVDDRLEYEADTSRGDSGAPLFFQEDDLFFVSGIHTQGGAHSNERGVWLDQERFEQLQAWRDEGDNA